MSSRKDDEYLLQNQLGLQAPCLCSVSRGREHDGNCLIPWKYLVVISVPLKAADSIIYSLGPGAQLSLPRVAKMHLQHFSRSGMCCSAQSSLFLKQLLGTPKAVLFLILISVMKDKRLVANVCMQWRDLPFLANRKDLLRFTGI